MCTEFHSRVGEKAPLNHTYVSHSYISSWVIFTNTNYSSSNLFKYVCTSPQAYVGTYVSLHLVDLCVDSDYVYDYVAYDVIQL